MATFDLESYATVQERIAQFWQDFPDGGIITEMVLRDGPEVIFKTTLYRNPEEQKAGIIFATGYAREIEGKTPVNKSSHLENCESSSCGRSLANAGYATDARRPSRNEMMKVARVRDEHEQLLEYIRTVGPKVGDSAQIEINGNAYPLKEFVRKNWTTIKEQFRIARLVVDAIEVATETHFGEEAGAEGNPPPPAASPPPPPTGSSSRPGSSGSSRESKSGTGSATPQTITERQLKRFWAITRETGYTEEGVHRMLAEEFRLQSAKDLHRDIYEEACKVAGDSMAADHYNQNPDQAELLAGNAPY